jgi:hypothetical protein
MGKKKKFFYLWCIMTEKEKNDYRVVLKLKGVWTELITICNGVKLYCNKLNWNAITAIATLLLAILTFAYLIEVRNQRELIYQQLLLSNKPAIQIFQPQLLKIGEETAFQAMTENSGGEARNLEVLLAIFFIEGSKMIPENAEKVEWVFTSSGCSVLNRNKFHTLKVLPNKVPWLESAFKKTDKLVYVLQVCRFISPPILLSDKPEINSLGEAFIFDGKRQVFDTCGENDYQNLREIGLKKAQGLENKQIFEIISAADRSSWGSEKYPLGKSNFR